MPPRIERWSNILSPSPRAPPAACETHPAASETLPAPTEALPAYSEALSIASEAVFDALPPFFVTVIVPYGATAQSLPNEYEILLQLN